MNLRNVEIPMPRWRRSDDAPDGSARASDERIVEPSEEAASAWRGPLAGMSIRWRLTLTYSLLLLLTLSSFNLGIYWYVGNRRMDELVRETEIRAEQVRQDIDRIMRTNEQMMVIDQLPLGRFINSVIHESGIVREAFNPFVAPGTGLRVFDRRFNLVFPPERDTPEAGGQVANSLSLPDRDQVMRTVPNRMALMNASRGFDHLEIVTGAEGDEVLVYSTPVNRRNPVTGEDNLAAVVQLLTSMKSYNDTMATLGRILVVGTILATGLSLLTGAALAQTAIGPIYRIARTAERISRAQDLGRRIAVDCPRDELGHLAVTINEMLERVEAMFDRQSRFLADVSHELRTPLTTIRGEVELMQRTGHVDPEALAAVQSESQRMSRLIDDLLLLARAETGASLAADRKPLGVDALMLDVFQQAQMLARNSEGHEVELDHVEPAVISGDADRLKQLLLNLIHNAFKHTPDGTTVWLAMHRDPNSVRLVVSDDGPGIPAEDVPHVFDRFYRVDKARHRASGGAGLGLSIVASIARAHDGDVSVACPAGGGTTFTVTLPLLDDDLAPTL